MNSAEWELFLRIFKAERLTSKLNRLRVWLGLSKHKAYLRLLWFAEKADVAEMAKDKYGWNL